MPIYMAVDDEERKVEVANFQLPRGNSQVPRGNLGKSDRRSAERWTFHLVVLMDLTDATKMAAFRRFFNDFQKGDTEYSTLSLTLQPKEGLVKELKFKGLILTKAEIRPRIDGAMGILVFDAEESTGVNPLKDLDELPDWELPSYSTR
jgi:hypothetical protein